MLRKTLVAVALVGLISVLASGQNQQTQRVKKISSTTSTTSRRAQLPATAEPSISAALGRDIKSYYLQGWGKGFRAVNEQQKFSVDLTPGKINVRGGKAVWSISLISFGYGEAIENPGSVIGARVKSNRLEYRRACLTEWYVNGPGGIEQGFTIFRAPGEAHGRPLTVSLAVPDGLAIMVNPDKAGMEITSPKGGRLRYQGLIAYDATGKHLPTWLEAQEGRISLRVNDRGASYPIIIDPLIQLAELTASDGASGDQLGISVAISGNTVVVGAENATVGSNAGQGAAYVFVKPANGWENITETAKLTASDGQAGDGFGGAVSIAGDTIVVGACSQSGMCNGTGAAYVFLRPAGGWKTTSTFKAKLTPSDGTPNNGFSNMLQVSADGSTVVIGAWGTTVGGNANEGEAYVYVKPSNGWNSTTETARLGEPNGAAYDDFGNVSISGDGGTIFVGAPEFNYSNGSATGAGKVYLFLRPASGWKSTTRYAAKLTASDGILGDQFGFCQAGSVCLSADGKTVLATAIGLSGPGRAYIFVKPAAGWKTTSQFTAELTASDGQTGDNFGWSAAITSYAAAVGAVSQNHGQGAVYVFVKPQGGWKTTSHFNAKLIASDGSQHDLFGFSTAVSGKTIAVGAVNHLYSNGTPGPGAGYVFGP